MTAPAAAPSGLSYLWMFDPAHQRMVLYEISQQGMRPVAAHAAPGSDNSDLGNIPVTPLIPEVLAHMQGALQQNPDDVAAVQQVQLALNQDSSSRGFSVFGVQPASEQRGTRDLPADINAQTNIARTVLSAQSSDDQLNQTEHRLRTEMAQYGVPAQDLFNQYQMQQPVAGGAVSQDASGLRLPADYVNAYTDRNATALEGQRLSRAEYLQQVANAWDARKTGADRLQQYGDTIRAQRDAQGDYDNAEMMANADTGQDRNLMALPNGQWTHRQNAGAANNLRDLGQKRDQMTQAWYPDQWVEQERQRVQAAADGGGAVDPSWNIQRRLPTYAEGGGYGGYQNPTPTAYQENNAPDEGDFQAVAHYTQQQGFQHDLEQKDYSQQIARIQQQAQFQMQQIDQRHAQRMGALQQDLSLAQQASAQQSQGYAQQRGYAQGQYDLQPLAGRGPQGWAG